MDFIRSAIDKARSERSQRRPEEHAPGLRDAGPEAEAVAPQVARDALWAGLEEFQPRPRHLKRNRIYAVAAGGEAAAFDITRTKLLHQMRSNRWRRVAITSPTPACGKTTLSLNLAFSLGRQADLRTMLVELDLRRPTMAQLLGQKEARQFSEVLEGRAPAEEHLVRIGETLAVGTNRASVASSAELLHKVETGQIMDALELQFAPDVMIFDMPPMLLTDDTLAFIDQIDCVLLVAAAGNSSMAEITRCAEELSARCNFLGVVLNKCRYLDGGDAYGYGYGYGYGHGYGGGRRGG